MDLKQVVHCGLEYPPVPWIPLRAGPLAMDFDPQSASLRHIRLGSHEVIRGVYAAVRDQNWGTIAPSVQVATKAVGPSGFRLHFEVECRQGDIDFLWQGRLSGAEDGTIQFLFQGQAKSAFQSNRIGFCVLHPIAECAGKPCWIEEVDGKKVKGCFPLLISPHQPFKNIRAIAHEIAPGCAAEIRLEGAAFEMEDQRNWTDASFKTYCTPLELPFPVAIRKGAEIQQLVTLRLLGDPIRSMAVISTGNTVEIQIDHSKKCRPPRLGLAMPSHGQPASDRERVRLKKLRLDHLRVELHPQSADWQARLKQAVEEAVGIETGLEAALFLSDNFEAELRALMAAAMGFDAPIRQWIVYSTRSWSDINLETVVSMLQSTGWDIPIAAGTNANFAEWNRQRPGQGIDVMPCFAITPQIHSFDRSSIVETLQAQSIAVESAWALARRPVVISPVTLRPRFNAVAIAPSADLRNPDELPSQVDIRQLSLFCAGWTLGSIAALCGAGGCHSITYYETTGWRGIMETEQGSPLPALFPSMPGSVLPVYHVFAGIAGYSHVAPVAIGNHRELAGLALFQGDVLGRILLANLGHDPVDPVVGLEAASAGVRMLDVTTVFQAMANPEEQVCQVIQNVPENRLALHLAPFAMAQIDLSP
jgi:hypothetical protein